jgi:dipeptidase E
MNKRHIVAMGGGGFSMEPHNPLLDLYVLKLTEKNKPKVCFIPTASGDSQGYIDRFYKNFNQHQCVPSHLSLFHGQTSDLENFILAQDVLYVGGGNTRNLLTLWKDWGLDKIIRKAYENGTVLAGISAGSLCWFEQGVTDSIPGRLSSLTCLGFLKGSNCPHYDGESNRRPAYHQLMLDKEILPGVATDDGVAAHFINEEVSSYVSSRPDARAYSVSLLEGEIKETEHRPKYLGGMGLAIRRAAVADAEAIHTAHMKSIQEVCSQDHTPEEIKAWGHRPYNEAQRLSAIKNDAVWVIEDHGVIEGYGHFKLYEKNEIQMAHILGLYLTPKVLGKKLGRTIIDLMLVDAKEKKIKEMTLEATLTAHDFYKKMGFEDSGPQTSVEISGQQIRCYPMKMIIA